MAARMFSEDQLEQLRSFPDIGKDNLIRVSRVSELGGSGVAGPGVRADLIGMVLAWPDGGNLGSGELAAQPGEHVGGGRAGLGAGPRAQPAPAAEVGGGGAGAGVTRQKPGMGRGTP